MRILVTAFAVLAVASMASALQIVIDFEAPTYSTGALNGQDGWTEIVSNGGTADVINTDNGPTLPGEQSVLLTNVWGDIRLEKNIGDIVAAGGPLVTFQYDIKNNSNMSPTNTWRSRLYDSSKGYAAIGNMHYDGGAGPASQAWASSTPDGKTGGWAPGGPGWQDTDWHTVVWTLDYSTNDFVSVTFDGTVYPQDGWWFYDWVGDGSGIATAADLLRMWLFAGGGDDVWTVDNYIITATPEPATLSLLALGGLALIRRRK